MNHLLYMDDLKLYAKFEIGLESLVNTVRIFSADVAMDQFWCHKVRQARC